MKRRRCQILLDFETWDQLKAEAIRRGISVSALVRQRLNGAQAISGRPGESMGIPGQDSLASTHPAPEASPIDQRVGKPIVLFDLG